MTSYFPVVVQVVPFDDYKVQIYFDDGKIVEYDMSEKLTGVFEQLKDIEVFKRSCTVLNETLAFDLAGKWDETACLDIDPCVLYELEAIQPEDEKYLA